MVASASTRAEPGGSQVKDELIVFFFRNASVQTNIYPNHIDIEQTPLVIIHSLSESLFSSPDFTAPPHQNG